MSLRALGSLLTRRFAAQRIPRAQAESSAGIGIKKAPGSSAGRPARSLHTLRDLAFGDGSYGPGAAAAAALAGFVTLLYFNRDTEKSAAEVTSVVVRKEVPPHALQELQEDTEKSAAEVTRKEVPPHVLQELQEEEALKVKFMDKDGKVNWREYLEYLDNRRYRGGKHYDKEVSGKKAMDKVTGSEDVELEDLKVDEEAMRARFEAWMKEYDRSYKSEEEKARRYEIFKKKVMNNDRLNKLNASKPNGPRFGTTEFSDWTSEEWNSQMGGSDPFPWEEYFAYRKTIIAEGRGMTSKAKNTKDVSDKAIKN